MAEKDFMTLEVEVPTMADGVVSVPQFGMRYPDGTIVWGADRHGGRDIPFKGVAEGSSLVRSYWDSAMRDRAEQCKVDLNAYKNGHQLIRRMVFIGTLKPEDVTPIPGVTEASWQ